uniref:Mitochondrial nucleoid factor 1 n=1 Tax=Apteryx owenii TaxID=8824 RepID=A0A8B9PAM0_APTOW
MAATRYRRFLKLCEEWPVEETKRQRDLGVFLRQRVAQAFREDEKSKRKIYVRQCSCKRAFIPLLFFLFPPSPFADILKQMEEMKKGTWKKLRERFYAKKSEEDSK